MFIICHLALVNILSGRMYRRIKLGFDDQVDVHCGQTNINFRTSYINGLGNQISRPAVQSGEATISTTDISEELSEAGRETEWSAKRVAVLVEIPAGLVVNDVVVDQREKQTRQSE